MSDPSSPPGSGPRHVAIIMDGNGRWAERRGLPRAVGHREGVQALKRTVQAAPKLGIECLTVFGFSTENWRRSAEEVSDLMGLVRAYVGSDLARLKREGVRVRILGRREGLPPDIADIVARTEAETAANDRFRLQVAFNYGGRADIVDAARKLAAQGAALDEDAFGRALSTGDGPPVDVIVRTSGERRLSNFLLWEAAYAEFVFQDVLWPDYGEEALAEAVAAFRDRDWRYGGRPAASA
ncbi:MAG: di-trans,poly-cis-decaprenylcistransferase [Alphaproteobacteria bacterium]|nr:di-trans,poly-cis-decaprenylcistransferase [Alphaproteobacteria bacterium]